MSVFYTARKTIRNYANSGNILILATMMALIIVNMPFLTELYNSLWVHEVALQVGDFNLFSHNGHPMTVMQFINDALMAFFFLSVGLEIKREVLVGELSSFRNALLPIIAAIGGMVVPVLIYRYLSQGTDFADGWAIPMATDIAFSLGVLAMLGNRVPIGLKVFLTTLAVVDDIGGIMVIALFYSGHIEYTMLLWAAAFLVALFIGGRLGVQSKLFYGALGTCVWFCFLNAGIHPTIAGVLVAFTIPSKPVYAPEKYVKSIRQNISYFTSEDDDKLNSRTILDKNQMNLLKQIETASDKVISPLQDMEDTLHPFVNYIIVPLFAFANAGIFFGGMEISQLYSGIAPAIILSLVVGKFVGIFLFSWLTIICRLAPMPEGGNWSRMASVSMLGGIGFTVSLFIANLSFGANASMAILLNDAKLGILVASILAGILGWLLLHFSLPQEPQDDEDDD
ncbi:MAG: Na+/H+ antiporter NhaA [Muribaculaceae bacterium]|nr:Na+/H+ antiporter NhaA [Muribaculaceae bacterium]MDD6943207.1 Na+/H+ antiporter NhaA [Bacteroidales bacterium]MDY2733002.1 Na+/H+ antiporter NhaA [Muribaculaceae bacterium]MDY4649436.1 Na+/H+ antiporter NhaA [Muribaculaceae bacterium]